MNSVKVKFEAICNKLFTIFEDDELTMNTLLKELVERTTKVEIEKRRINRLLADHEKNKTTLKERESTLIKLIKDNKEKNVEKALELLKSKKNIEDRLMKVEVEHLNLKRTQDTINKSHDKLHTAILEIRRKRGDIIARQSGLGIIEECGVVDLCFDEVDKIEARLLVKEEIYNYNANSDSYLNQTELEEVSREELIQELNKY